MHGRLLIGGLLLLLLSCNHSYKNTSSVEKYKGVHWTLLAFEDTTRMFQKGDWLWLDAEFLNEKDSVFWNSRHEGADKFFIQLGDTTSHPFFFPFYQSSCGDSLMIVAPKSIVLQDVFNLKNCPYFLNKDSTIKCFVKIKKQITSAEDIAIFRKNEDSIILHFLEKNKPLFEKDSMGIIWLEPLPVPEYKIRKHVRYATVAYSGYFLDGRMIDHSDSLGIYYGDTLQLIKGLNFVIKKLQVGQSAKIILPSPLAFGARGSLNKTIPPFTPLLYEITLMQIE